MSENLPTTTEPSAIPLLASAICSAVLFLDVDGVLNCGRTRERCPTGFTGVEPGKCEILRRILSETGANIVLSSTWRRHEKMLPYLWEHLGCVAQSRWIGSTPVLDTKSGGWLYEARPRGEEIDAWLTANPSVTKYVILDDDADMLPSQMENFVRTNNQIGLTNEIAADVIRRLNDQALRPKKI